MASSSYTTDALIVSAWMLISTGIELRCFLIMIWWLNQENLFKGNSSYSVPASQGQSTAVLATIERTRNSNETERGDGVKQMCCCFGESCMNTGYAHTDTHHYTQSHIHVHRQQRHSIILVEGQSIYCWLTEIQSPFPTGPQWKNGRQPVKKPTLSW